MTVKVAYLHVAPPPLTATRALEVEQSGPNVGPVPGPLIYNQLAINDDCNPTGDTRTMGWHKQVNVGGPNSKGGKYADFVTLRKWLATVNAGDAIARVGQTVSDVADGGPGELYGGNDISYALAGCVTQGVNGHESDTKIMAGATVPRRSGYRSVNEGNSVAAQHDAGYSIMSAMAGGGFKTGWLLSKHFGQAPLQPDGEVFGAEGAQTVAHVLNYPNLNVTGYIVNLPSFKVTGSGTVTLAGQIPELVLYESDGPAAAKYRDIYVNCGALKFDVLDENFANRTNVLTLGPTKPVVTGSRTGASPLTLSILAALNALCVITDNTTP